MDSVDDADQYHAPPIFYLSEKIIEGPKASDKVMISLISVCPSTGEVQWDHFEGLNMLYLYFRSWKFECIVDGQMRIELEVSKSFYLTQVLSEYYPD